MKSARVANMSDGSASGSSTIFGTCLLLLGCGGLADEGLLYANSGAAGSGARAGLPAVGGARAANGGVAGLAAAGFAGGASSVGGTSNEAGRGGLPQGGEAGVGGSGGSTQGGSGGLQCVSRLEAGRLLDSAACRDCTMLFCAVEVELCMAARDACACGTWGGEIGQMSFMLECLADRPPSPYNLRTCAEQMGLGSYYSLEKTSFQLLECMSGGPPPRCPECFGRPGP